MTNEKLLFRISLVSTGVVIAGAGILGYNALLATSANTPKEEVDAKFNNAFIGGGIMIVGLISSMIIADATNKIAHNKLDEILKIVKS